MPLGLSPRESTIAEDQFQQMPTAVVPQATTGEIAAENIEAVPKTLLGGVAQSYAAYRGIASNFGALGGYDPETDSVVEQTPEEVQRKFALDSTKIANQYAPDPRKSGAGAQWLYNIGSGAVKMVGDTMVTGNPVAGAALFGLTEGVNTRDEIYAATGDKTTADKLAIGSALFSGTAALLPGGYGSTFASRIASGAVAQTTFGVLQRDMMHTGLQDAGYTDMARQYVPLDGSAMMADAILGTIFGGVHHIFSPDITDSARAVKDSEHAERSSPGLPTDPASRQNALDALGSHISSMIRGDDTPPPTGDVSYVPDAAQDAAREAAAKTVQEAKHEVLGKQEEAPVEPTVTPEDVAALREEISSLPKASTLGRAARVEAAAKEEAGQVAQMDPATQEAISQAQAALKETPDLHIASENDQPVRADEALRQAMEDLKNSRGDDELHRVALACAGRA